MSLHQQVTVKIGQSDPSLLIGALVSGLSLPLAGISPPLPLFLKHETLQFNAVSQLDRKPDKLDWQKQQLGLTLEKLTEFEQKIEQANARLAAAILPPNEAPVRRGTPPPPPPPPLPKNIDYNLSSLVIGGPSPFCCANV